MFTDARYCDVGSYLMGDSGKKALPPQPKSQNARMAYGGNELVKKAGFGLGI